VKERRIEMIREKAFLRVFKKNCKEMLKTVDATERAINNLSHQGCPFPEGCIRDEERGGCIGNSPIRPTKNCPISIEWQSNVFYFQKNKDGPDGRRLCEKMIRIIRGEE
jgi:hypothetical protein